MLDISYLYEDNAMDVNYEYYKVFYYVGKYQKWHR